MEVRAVAEAYFDAIARRDVEAMAGLWAADGEEHIAGQVDAVGPGGVREYFTDFFAAYPDFAVEVQSIVRQLGLVPDGGSAAEQRLFAAFNTKTRLERRAAAKRDLERVADGVWVLRGGVPRTMNVYFLEDEGGGVTLYDAGIRAMTHAVAAAAAPLGGINRVVLGHADADHRGVASGLGVPVLCHPADREAAGDPSPLRTYHRLDRLGIPARYVYRHLLSFWDGGPVEIADTVEEGDDVSGFRVVHLPGHAPGLIGLFREHDRLALTSGCFYVIDPEA